MQLKSTRKIHTKKCERRDSIISGNEGIVSLYWVVLRSF